MTSLLSDNILDESAMDTARNPAPLTHYFGVCGGQTQARASAPPRPESVRLACAREREQRHAIPHGWGRQYSTKHLL